MTARIIGAALAFALAGALPAAARPSDAPPVGFIAKAHGVWVHEASGVEFPARAAGFVRAFERPMDENGKDFVLSYSRRIHGEPVVARITMFQLIGLTPQQHFLALQSMVGTYFRDLTFTNVTLGGEGPFDPPHLKPGSGYQGRFRGDLKGVPYELSLSTVRFGAWDARLTAAYPSSDADDARKRILALADAIQLPEPKPRRR